MKALFSVLAVVTFVFVGTSSLAVQPQERSQVACGKSFTIAVNEPVISCKTADGVQEFASEKTNNRADLITRLKERVCSNRRDILDITCSFGFEDKDGRLAELYTYSLKGLDKVTSDAFQQAWDQWIMSARLQVRVDASMPANGRDGVRVMKSRYQHTTFTLAIDNAHNLKVEELATCYFAEIGAKVLGVKTPDEAGKKYGQPLRFGKGVALNPLPDDAPEWLKAFSLLP